MWLRWPRIAPGDVGFHLSLLPPYELAEILSSLQELFVIGLVSEPVSNLLLSFIDCVGAVNGGICFSVAVKNLDLSCPLLIFEDMEAVVVILYGRCLGFGFLLNLGEDIEGIFDIFGYTGLELFNLLDHLCLWWTWSHWSLVLAWESGAPDWRESLKDQDPSSGGFSLNTGMFVSLRVWASFGFEDLKEPFLSFAKSDDHWSHDWLAKQDQGMINCGESYNSITDYGDEIERLLTVKAIF